MRSLDDMTRSEDANPRFTLDTNLLVYSVDLDAGTRHQLTLRVVDRAPDVDCWLTFNPYRSFMLRLHASGLCRRRRQLRR